MLLIILINVAWGSEIEQENDIEIFPDVGLVFKTNKDLVLVHGIAKGKVSLRLNLPTVEISDEDGCAALQSDEETFRQTLNNSYATFRGKISDELDEFGLGQNEPKSIGGSDGENSDKTTTGVSLGLDVRGCDNEGVQCEFFPVTEDSPTDSRYHKLIPCYDASLGAMNNSCAVEGGIGVCCSRIAKLNTNKCPIELGRAVFAINSHIQHNPNTKYKMGHGLILNSKIRNYCMALVKATLNGKVIYSGPHSNGSKGRMLPGYMRGKRRKRSMKVVKRSTRVNRRSRVKRSSWNYLTHGWIFSSSYIDSSVQTVKDIEKADLTVVKAALEKNSNVILKLEADSIEREGLEKRICSITGQITETLVLNHLENAQFRLETKAESMLRECSRGVVPDSVSYVILHKLCSSVTTSVVCANEMLVRSLFGCEIATPKIEISFVDVRFIFSFKIPVSESYSSQEVITIGVPFKNNLIDSSINITDLEKSEEKEKHSAGGPTADNEQLKMALGEIFGELLSKRSKREIIRTFHFVALRGIPEIMFEHNNDLLLFNKGACVKTMIKSGFICDYSNLEMRSAECVKAVREKDHIRIPNYCGISLFSSNYECITTPIGVKGYTISSHKFVPIVQESSLGVFNNDEKVMGCDRVCFVAVGDVKKNFQCGGRSFNLEVTEDVSVKTKEIRITKLSVEGLKTRKHELADLESSGFSMLDRVVRKDQLIKMKTVSTIISSLIGIIFILIVIKCCIKKSCWWVYGCCRCVKYPTMWFRVGKNRPYEKIRKNYNNRKIGDFEIGDNYG